MRSPSASLKSSIQALHVRPEHTTPEEWVRAIAEIATQTHPAVALALAPLALVPDRGVARAAVQALQVCLSRLNETGILWIAREGRKCGIWSGPWQSAWCELRQPDVQRLETFGYASVGLLCIGSVHANGHVRQACVERLANVRGALPLTFLLVRINDWVRPVRAVARLTVLGRLLEARQGDTKRCEELLENLMLVPYIEQWNRDDHGPIRDAIESTLKSTAFHSVREMGLRHKRIPLRLRMYRVALDQSADAPFAVLRDAITSRNGTIRAWAARESTKRLTGEELRLLVDFMKTDSLAILRHEAVFALATKLPPMLSATLKPFLHDSSPDVRFLAGYYLAENHYDLRAHYLEALPLAQDCELPGIVAGIGEKGKPGDESAVTALRGHPDPRVRRAVVFTRGKLQRDGDISWLFESLRDPHKLVVREAARQIEARIHIVESSVIEAWFQSEPRLSMRREALRIGAKMESWEALGFLLHAAVSEDVLIHHEVERQLDRWCDGFIYNYPLPNPEQLARLEERFAAVRGKLDQDLSKWIVKMLPAQKKR